MFARVVAITLNTYREAVRARILYGLFAIALATTAFLLVIAQISLRQEQRVIADIGSASISLYAVLVAILIGATSLHREVELKTIYPILTRELRRHEYLLGKYFGTLATLLVFIAVDGAAVLGILALQANVSPTRLILAGLVMLAILGVALVYSRARRVFVLLPWSLVLYAVCAWLASPASGEQQLVLASNALALAEVAIVTAIAMLFSSFSSPFLTGTFTLGVFIIGRSADSLANLPERVVGPTARAGGHAISLVVPNLHLYVPPRPLLLGQDSANPTWTYVLSAAGNAVFYAVLLLIVSALIFRKRDFQ